MDLKINKLLLLMKTWLPQAAQPALDLPRPTPDEERGRVRGLAGLVPRHAGVVPGVLEGGPVQHQAGREGPVRHHLQPPRLVLNPVAQTEC